ncbi:MAG: alpha/beta hydrolase [Deltaproteobacteria bacterium]
MAVFCLGIILVVAFDYHWPMDRPIRDATRRNPHAEVPGAVDLQSRGTDFDAETAASADGNEVRDSAELLQQNSLLAKFARKQTYSPVRADDLSPERWQLPGGRVHAVALQTDDGLTLNGWHFLADGCSAANRAECDRELSAGRPLALYFPGNSGHRGDRVAEAGVLTRAGADVLLFDYRGYGDNMGTPAEDAFAADARAAWRYATVERRVTPRRIILYGESIGGAVATRLAGEMCAVRTPPAGLFIRSTSSNLADAARHRYPFLPKKMLPAERYAAVEYITRVTCPLVMLHGEQDQTIPHELGRKVFDAAPEKSGDGIPKQFVDLPHSDHNDVVETDGALLENAVDEFVKRLFSRR